MRFQIGEIAAIAASICALTACADCGSVTDTEPETPAAVSVGNTTGWGIMPHVAADATSASEEVNALAVEVRLSPRMSPNVKVDYMTLDGSAKAGTDYRHTKGQFTFQSGQNSWTIEIPLIADDIAEQKETFSLLLHVSDNATLDTPEVTLTIVDDDTK